MRKGKKDLKGTAKPEIQVYYEVYVYGAGVTDNCDTLEKAIDCTDRTSTRARITKVTREVMEVGK